MPSPFQGINVAGNALRAFQRQQEVAGHNIANVNTPGYSRQSATLGQTPGLNVPGSPGYTVGTGVSVTTVERIRDMFLEARMQSAGSDMGRLTTLADNLRRVEPVLGEPAGNGVSDALNRFFNGWSALSSNAGDASARLEVQQAGEALATRLRAAHREISEQEARMSTELGQTVSQVNELSNRIASLNGQIRTKLGAGVVPNDLLDARDLAVQDLGKLVDVRTTALPDGSINVYVDQYSMVEGSLVRPLPPAIDPSTATFVADGVTYRIRSGKLSGLATAQNSLASYRGQLDTLANTLRTEVNSLHQSGINKLGNTGVNFFADVAPPAQQTGAFDFSLSAEVQADAQAIAAGASGAAGDGGVALSLSRLRETPLAALNNRSMNGYFQDLVSAVGRDSSNYSRALDTQKSIVDQIENQRQGISGVSLDDEMANMMRFQRSYQAAAKLLTVFDQMTEDLLGILRR